MRHLSDISSLLAWPNSINQYAQQNTILCATLFQVFTPKKMSLTFGSFTSSVLQTVLYILSQGSCKLLRLFIAGDAYRSRRKLCNDVECRILLSFGADVQGDSISHILFCQFPQSSLTYAFIHGKYKLHKEISTKIIDEVMMAYKIIFNKI